MKLPSFRRWSAAAWLAAAPLFAQGKLEPLDLKFVAADAHALLIVRPAAIMALPELKPVGATVAKTLLRGADPKEFAEFAVVGFDAGKESVFRLVAKDASAFDAIKKYIVGEPVTVGGKHGQFSATSGWLEDGETLLIGKQEAVLRVAKPKAGEPAWADLLGSERGLAVGAIDVAAFLAANPLPPVPVPAISEMIAALGPCKTAVGRLTLDGDDLSLEIVAACPDAASAEKLAAATNGVLGFAAAQLAQVPAQARKQGPPVVNPKEAFEAAEKFMKVAKAKADGKHATLTAQLPVHLMAAMVAGPLAAQGATSARVENSNNLHQIVVALQKYADKYGAFPAAAWKGPDGKAKHAHSWRVAILPFHEQEALYKEYQLDEPWDSPDNEKVLAKMPAVFRHPADPEAEKNHWTNVFALVGDGAAWDEDAGVKLADFTDGLDKTVLLVTAKRKIPWTKPKDINYEKNGDLPELGGLEPGGWNMAMADAMVRFISESIDKKSWRAIITRAGGDN